MNVKSEEVDLVSMAIAISADKHKFQVDKAGKHYIFHPLRVMLALQNESKETQIVAVLHDTIEDTDLTLTDVRKLFGDIVADALDSVSRRIEPTKETYHDFILRAKSNVIGRKVKIADLKDNMSAERIENLSDNVKSIINRYRKALNELESD